MESKLDKKKLENTRKVRDSKKMCRSIECRSIWWCQRVVGKMIISELLEIGLMEEVQ